MAGTHSGKGHDHVSLLCLEEQAEKRQVPNALSVKKQAETTVEKSMPPRRQASRDPPDVPSPVPWVQ